MRAIAYVLIVFAVILAVTEWLSRRQMSKLPFESSFCHRCGRHLPPDLLQEHLKECR